MPNDFDKDAYFKKKLLNLLKYSVVYFVLDLTSIYLGPTVGWLVWGMFFLIILVLSVLQLVHDFAEMFDSEKSWGYAFAELNTKYKAISLGLAIGVALLFTFAALPYSLKTGQFETVRKEDSANPKPHVVYIGFNEHEYDDNNDYIHGITVFKAIVHFCIDFTKISLTLFVVTQVQMLCSLSIQFYHKIV